MKVIPTISKVQYAMLRVAALCALWVLAVSPLVLQGQGVLIGPVDAPPHGSALLHMDGSAYPAQAKKGLLPPEVELTRTDQEGPVGPLPLPPTLIVFNTATTSLTGNLEQYNVYPGLYAWDGTRWLRMEAGLGRQVYLNCNPSLRALDNSTTPVTTILIPSASAFVHRLIPGDRVVLEASGMFQMTPVGATDDADRWVTVEVEIYKMSPLPMEVLARTFISFDTRFAASSSTSAFFGFYSSGSSGFEQRSSVQNWSLVALYEPTLTNNYTFSVKARKLSRIGVINTIEAGNPCLRSEVFKH